MEYCTPKNKAFFENINGNVLFNEDMSGHTSFKVGGPADIYVEPYFEEDVKKIAGYAGKEKIPLSVIGGGTNILVRDRGIRGIVLSLKSIKSDYSFSLSEKNVELIVGGGASTRNLCSFAKKNRWSGLEFATGIPGSVGGAINVNAGTKQGEFADIVTSLKVLILSNGEICNIQREDLDFSYRSLDWHLCTIKDEKETPLILSATLGLRKTELKHSVDDLKKKRLKSQPIGEFSAGCFFRNPAEGKSAGELVDLAGLKGTAKGDAYISEKHANFIINKGNAKAEDILWLSRLVQDEVYRQFGVQLLKEVKVIGE